MKKPIKIPKKYEHMIAEVSDERNNGDGVWFYLKSEYWNYEMECGIIHEQTLRECLSQLKYVKLKPGP
jgi:hypothetical protein